MNAIFKYPGSKWSIAKWIIEFFPEHHSYLEPFAGSLAVLMNKPRSKIETVNDLDENVVNLFEWIKKTRNGSHMKSTGHHIAGVYMKRLMRR